MTKNISINYRAGKQQSSGGCAAYTSQQSLQNRSVTSIHLRNQLLNVSKICEFESTNAQYYKRLNLEVIAPVNWTIEEQKDALFTNETRMEVRRTKQLLQKSQRTVCQLKLIQNVSFGGNIMLCRTCRIFCKIMFSHLSDIMDIKYLC